MHSLLGTCLIAAKWQVSYQECSPAACTTAALDQLALREVKVSAWKQACLGNQAQALLSMPACVSLICNRNHTPH